MCIEKSSLQLLIAYCVSMVHVILDGPFFCAYCILLQSILILAHFHQIGSVLQNFFISNLAVLMFGASFTATGILSTQIDKYETHLQIIFIHIQK